MIAVSSRVDVVRGRASGGFTLMELLIVLIIIGVVSTLGSSAFVTVTTAWNDQRVLSQLNAVAEEVFGAIERDLSDTLSHDLSGIAISGMSREAVDRSTVPAAHNADDTLIIPVQGAADGRTHQRTATVGYRIDRNMPSQPLVRTIGELSESFPVVGNQSVAPSAKTVAFRVEYLSADTNRLWVNEWSGQGHPAAVRVSITLADPERPDRQLSRKSVLRVHVQ